MTIKPPDKLVLDWADEHQMIGNVYVQLSRVTQMNQLLKTANLKNTMIRTNDKVVNYLLASSRHSSKIWEQNNIVMANCKTNPTSSFRFILDQFPLAEVIVLSQCETIEGLPTELNGFNCQQFHLPTNRFVVAWSKLSSFEYKTIFEPQISVIMLQNLIFFIKNCDILQPDDDFLKLAEISFGPIVASGDLQLSSMNAMFNPPNTSSITGLLPDNIYVSDQLKISNPCLIPNWYSKRSIISYHFKC